MTPSDFDPYTPIALEDRYSLIHIFNAENFAVDPACKSLDAILIETVEKGATDLHLWFRSILDQGNYRFRISGHHVDETVITVGHCKSIMTEIYQLIANEEGINVSDTRINSWGKSLNHKLSNGLEVRLYIGVGLTIPHGFDLLCRVLVK